METNGLDAKLAAAYEKRSKELEKLLLEVLDTCEQARNHLCEAGEGRQYDPSWIRPKLLTKQQVQESAIQAYHELSSIINRLTNL